jgi:alpha,alpha-trehalase
MLPFLFSADSLVQIFEQLGYAFRREEIPRLVDYYDARTSHGSTLSKIVHGWVVARTNRAQSWALFTEALRADLEDVQGGTTREGIHLGSMCGTIDMIQNGYLGCEVRGDALHVNPLLPDALRRVRTRVRYLGQDVEIEATRETVRLSAAAGSGDTIYVAYRGRVRRLPPGGETVFRLIPPREHHEAAPLDMEPAAERAAE